MAEDNDNKSILMVIANATQTMRKNAYSKSITNSMTTSIDDMQLNNLPDDFSSVAYCLGLTEIIVCNRIKNNTDIKNYNLCSKDRKLINYYMLTRSQECVKNKQKPTYSVIEMSPIVYKLHKPIKVTDLRLPKPLTIKEPQVLDYKQIDTLLNDLKLGSLITNGMIKIKNIHSVVVKLLYPMHIRNIFNGKSKIDVFDYYPKNLDSSKAV